MHGLSLMALEWLNSSGHRPCDSTGTCGQGKGQRRHLSLVRSGSNGHLCPMVIRRNQTGPWERGLLYIGWSGEVTLGQRLDDKRPALQRYGDRAPHPENIAKQRALFGDQYGEIRRETKPQCGCSTRVRMSKTHKGRRGRGASSRRVS